MISHHATRFYPLGSPRLDRKRSRASDNEVTPPPPSYPKQCAEPPTTCWSQDKDSKTCREHCDYNVVRHVSPHTHSHLRAPLLLPRLSHPAETTPGPERVCYFSYRCVPLAVSPTAVTGVCYWITVIRLVKEWRTELAAVCCSAGVCSSGWFWSVLTGPFPGAPGQWSGYVSSLAAQQSQAEVGTVRHPEQNGTSFPRLGRVRQGVVHVNVNRRTRQQLMGHRVPDQNLQNNLGLCRVKVPSYSFLQE